MKRIVSLIVVISIIFSAGTSYSLDRKDYFDVLSFLHLQITAVTIDMYKYIGWFSDGDEGVKEAAEENIKRLDKIKDTIEKIKAPDELSVLKQAQLKMIDEMKIVYAEIPEKSMEDLREHFLRIDVYQGQVDDIYLKTKEQYSKEGKLPADFNPMLKEEARLAKNSRDRRDYISSVNLIRDKKYREAYMRLENLKDKYEGSSFGDCILLRMSDCLIISEEPLKMQDGTYKWLEDGIKILEKIVENQHYSPIIYEVFYKWRTAKQFYEYGMSNISEIPNLDYNEKRWELAKSVKRYIRKEEPNDMWAHVQLEMLMDLPNITRGGDLGNDNIIHYGILYGPFKHTSR